MSELLPADRPNEPFSVSALSRRLKATVEQQFGAVRVQGEISGFKRAASGHCYMNLKDEQSVLKAVIWKGVAAKLATQPEEGLEVIASGRVTTYEARSEYQLVIDNLEVAGIGALLKLLQERKEKLAAEGLFAAERKRALPSYPEVLGVITSPTGAVIQDILNRLQDRLPVQVLLYPVTVQGATACEEICQAIAFFNDEARRARLSLAKPDLLIIARGGGSLEDLLPFSEEAMVRAAADSRIPLISAVGHETDNSLLDLVADVRAPTPTAAAELAVRTKAQTIEDIGGAFSALQKSMRRAVELSEARVDGLGRGLLHPLRLLETRRQRLDDAAEHLRKNMAHLHEGYGHRLQTASARLSAPQEILRSVAGRYSEALQNRFGDLRKSMDYALERHATRLRHVSERLEQSDYHNILKRGFAIVRTRNGAGDWVATPSLATLGTERSVNIRLQDGDIDATIGSSSGKQSGGKRKDKDSDKNTDKNSGKPSLFD